MRQTADAAALALLERGLIDADSPSPLYFQLYTVLHDAIAKGVLPNESRMPSEKELADGFDVSRITARRTLAELAAKGLVVRHRGKGTFVSHADRPAPIVAPLGSNAESLGDLGRDTTLTVLLTLFERYGLRIARMERFLSAEGAAPDVARALDVPSGKPLLKLVRFSYDAQDQLQDHLVARYNSDLFSYRVETKVGLD